MSLNQDCTVLIFMLRKQPLIEDIFHPMLIIPWAPIYQEYIHELSKVGYLWTWFPILYYYVPWREFIGPDSDLLEEREGEKGLLTFFASVLSNIIHKLQIFFHIPMKHNFAKKKSDFLSGIWQKRKISYQTEGVQNFKFKCAKSCRPIVEMFILLNNCLLYRSTNESDLWLKENHSISIIAGISMYSHSKVRVF